MHLPGLAGRRIVVVGAGTQPSDEPDPPMGNGRAIAVRARPQRAPPWCAWTAIAAAAADTATLITDTGGDATVVVADVAAEDDCTRLVAEAGTPSTASCSTSASDAAAACAGRPPPTGTARSPSTSAPTS